ncbi:hypothetical protein [Clostridium sp.]|nr:hypothetical protein [Clostridium sp.]MBP3915476.1 hypothetical protein [Clostridium sp.]
MAFAARYGDYGEETLIAAYGDSIRIMNGADVEYATRHMKSLRSVAFKS